MQLKFGQIYLNKSWKYFAPIIAKHYGAGFHNKFTQFFKLAVGIGDAHYKKMSYPCFFFLIDREHYKNITLSSINWLRNQAYYVDDYAFDDLHTGRMHMIVTKIPKELLETYEEFLGGRYSRMLHENEIDIYFRKDMDLTGAYRVLTRQESAYTDFLEKINNSFGPTSITRRDLIGAELDFPIEKQKEIFNYGVE